MIKTWNATALTGGVTRALDAIPVLSLTDGDRAFVVVSGIIYYYEFDASATNAESSPDYIRPDDYATAGVWVLSRWYTQDKNYNRNLLINSDFSVNQEGYAANGVASLAGGEYGHDMWQVAGGASGEEIIYIKQASNGYITISSFTATSAGTVILWQKNDELIAANGQTVTVSFEVVSLSDSVEVVGAGLSTQVVSTTGVKSFTYTATADGYFGFRHTFAGAGTYTPNFRFKNLKIEYGSTATEYELPEPRAEELRCYKYYYVYKPEQSGGVTSNRPAIFTGVENIVSATLPVEMRTATVDVNKVGTTTLYYYNGAHYGTLSGWPSPPTGYVRGNTVTVDLADGMAMASTTLTPTVVVLEANADNSGIEFDARY